MKLKFIEIVHVIFTTFLIVVLMGCLLSFLLGLMFLLSVAEPDSLYVSTFISCVIAIGFGIYQLFHSAKIAKNIDVEGLKNRFQVKQKIVIKHNLSKNQLFDSFLKVFSKFEGAVLLKEDMDACLVVFKVPQTEKKAGYKVRLEMVNAQEMEIESRPLLLISLIDDGVNLINILFIKRYFQKDLDFFIPRNQSAMSLIKVLNSAQTDWVEKFKNKQKESSINLKDEDIPSVFSRIIAYLIDRFVIFFMLFLVLIPTFLIFNFTSIDIDSDIGVIIVIIATMFTMIIFVGYFVLRDSIFGLSIGRKLMKQKVINYSTGKSLSVTESFKRNIVFFIPYAVLWESYMVLFFDKKNRRRSGDKWADSIVVRASYVSSLKNISKT